MIRYNDDSTHTSENNDNKIYNKLNDTKNLVV